MYVQYIERQSVIDEFGKIGKILIRKIERKAKKKIIQFYNKCFTFRYVANRLSEMGETAMSPSSSTDMTDVDMASIAEDELSEKFSVQGIATGKTSGKTKIVR